jgi:hypothetical protein
MRMFIPVEEAFEEWRKDPAYVVACDALEEEIAKASAEIDARVKAEEARAGGAGDGNNAGRGGAARGR